MLWFFKVSHCSENFGQGSEQVTFEWSHYEPKHKY